MVRSRWRTGQIPWGGGCSPTVYGSLIYVPDGSSSFPNLGTAGAYPLTVSTTVETYPVTVTTYIASNYFIPKNAVGVGSTPAMTLTITEFGDLKPLCSQVASLGAGLTNGVISLDVSAELLPDVGAPFYGLSHLAGVALTNFFFTPDFVNSYMHSSSSGFGIGPYHEYSSTGVPLTADAATCEDALVGAGVVFIETSNQYSRDIYINGVNAYSNAFVGDGIETLGGPFSDFGVRLKTTEDAGWANVKRFGMFRRSCEPWTEADFPAILEEFYAA